ncbi:hypothetical protein MLD38_038038 [Melastoma candidum]|uniref:Uncharacterized protein n=1 Tax=Melastoma candidum TaxID=119954 RepID=A0ACB9KYS3_9MYRT|nr:hypothetical protein MLD38_038038 [Melastoma candidum]
MFSLPPGSRSFSTLVVMALATCALASASNLDFLTNATGEALLSFFKSIEMRSPAGHKGLMMMSPKNSLFHDARVMAFPTLNGESVSVTTLRYQPGSVNIPQSHPYDAELLFVSYGTLYVGYTDSSNKHYGMILQSGDMFIFPKSLERFQFSKNKSDVVVTMSAYGSIDGGTVSIPEGVRSTKIDQEVLAKSFKASNKDLGPCNGLQWHQMHYPWM